MIPDLTVTPAELQNFFILNIMDKHNEDFEEDDSKRDYSYLLEAIPAFLETVERDRKQALKHKKYTKGNNEEEEKDE
ncbi:hypothetical protein G6F68_012981 [Rhizopus microsporus]|nr:hypothetical protein G6F68_012981 [Rhizopus microsporus]